MIKYNWQFRSKFIDDERGFAFTATAAVISVILGLTILFMANTVRTESVRTADLNSGQSAYWEAIADVQMAADMIRTNGVGILPFISANFPNIIVTPIDQNNLVINSQVTIGSIRGGAQRAASINITSPLYSIIQNVGSPPFNITGFSEVDGGNLYIGNNVRIPSFWIWSLARVGRDSLVNFFIPNGNTVNPAVAQGGNNYTVTNIAPLTMPGFDHTAYNNLLNIAGAITLDNPVVGEYVGNTTLDNGTHPGGIDLQDVNFSNDGIFVNGNLTIDGRIGSGTTILDNNTAASPGLIVVDGNVTLRGSWFLWMPVFEIPDNIIIIASGDVSKQWVNFGESVTYPSNTWSNYVNEIYALGNLTTPGWSLGSKMFGQFYVFGSYSSIGWISRMSGVIYSPNSPYNFGTLMGAFPRFDGTFYVLRASSDQIAWGADINLDSRAILGRGLGGGLTQPLSIPWVVLPGTIQEI